MFCNIQLIFLHGKIGVASFFYWGGKKDPLDPPLLVAQTPFMTQQVSLTIDIKNIVKLLLKPTSILLHETSF